jgi:hypothetical protein
VWVVLLCGALAGCRGASAGPSAEPTGGRWRPVLLPSPDAIRLTPPPADGSEKQRREIEELVALSRRRAERPGEPTALWSGGACLGWNEIARQLVAKHRQSHPMASRTYALLSVAQYDALVAAWNNKYRYHRPPPHQVDSRITEAVAPPADPVYPSTDAVVAAASAAVLTELFPDEAAFLARTATDQEEGAVAAGITFRSDVSAGESLGREVAAVVVTYAREDGSDEDASDEAPSSSGGWVPAPDREPIEPHWARVRPWLLASPEQFRAPPPPDSSSPEFRAALAEVKRFSDTRTPAQARLAALWADGSGSYAPAGRWNKMAADLIIRHRLNELRTARALALLNMAVMDAGISAWDTKFRYATNRPTQFDPTITTPVREPNSPSYTCSHAAFSGAGSEVLGYLFPESRQFVRSKAEEAAMSRVYGGIQFRFEGDAGLAEGRSVAALAIARARSDGSP